MKEKGTNSVAGPELLVELSRTVRTPLRAQLENGLREAVRSGRLSARTRLPATRALASDLGVSRRLVVDAYAQLLAEGYLVARPGAGTFVADAAGAMAEPSAEPESRTPRFDFFPGSPISPPFPAGNGCERCARPSGMRPIGPSATPTPVARSSCDGRWPSICAACVAWPLTPSRSLCARAPPRASCCCRGRCGARASPWRTRGFRLSRDPHRPRLLACRAPGRRARRLRGRARGAHRAGRRDRRRAGDARAPIPIGVALAPGRRAALLEWAGESGGLVIEDDYDAEYRYDRAPLAALQGLAPDRVVYMGTVSKTLAPALRLGWLALPPRLLDAVIEQKGLADHGCPTLDQLALARLFETGAYDRHLRQARRLYRARRDALAAAVSRHLPGARVTGLAAGLHATVRLGRAVDGIALVQAALSASVGVYPLGYAYMEVKPVHNGLVLGYANLTEPAIEEGIRRLARALEGLPGG